MSRFALRRARVSRAKVGGETPPLRPSRMSRFALMRATIDVLYHFKQPISFSRRDFAPEV
jgi:hypothetical protein